MYRCAETPSLFFPYQPSVTSVGLLLSPFLKLLLLSLCADSGVEVIFDKRALSFKFSHSKCKKTNKVFSTQLYLVHLSISFSRKNYTRISRVRI